MEQVWFSAALWLILALIATLLSIWFRISTALSEIVVGTVAQLIIGALIGTEVLGAKSALDHFPGWDGSHRAHVSGRRGTRSRNISNQVEGSHGCGAGRIFRALSGSGGRGALFVELVASRKLAGWSGPVHHVSCRGLCRDAGTRLEPDRFRQRHSGGLFCQRSRNGHRPGPDLCPVHDADPDLCRCEHSCLRGAAICHSVVLSKYGGRVSELEAKYILFLLFGMGGLAAWAGSEAVLPAYIIGMVLAGNGGKGSHSDPAAAYPDLRPAHALLFHSRGIAGLRAGSYSPRRSFFWRCSRPKW